MIRISLSGWPDHPRWSGSLYPVSWSGPDHPRWSGSVYPVSWSGPDHSRWSGSVYPVSWSWPDPLRWSGFMKRTGSSQIIRLSLSVFRKLTGSSQMIRIQNTLRTTVQGHPSIYLKYLSIFLGFRHRGRAVQRDPVRAPARGEHRWDLHHWQRGSLRYLLQVLFILSEGA